ncbi:hypothetical protein QU845_25300, partial [Escherichia coli]|nr:hypothetical protein [Escherichia coli]
RETILIFILVKGIDVTDALFRIPVQPLQTPTILAIGKLALDDKQLVDQFELRVIRQPDPVAAVQRFIYGLLKSKYLFDQF